MEKISVAEAAKKLNVTTQFLRISLQQNKFPFGVAVDMSGKGRYRYHIFPERLDAYMKANL